MKPLQVVFPSRADPQSPVIDLDLHLPLLCFRPEKVLQVGGPGTSATWQHGTEVLLARAVSSQSQQRARLSPVFVRLLRASLPAGTGSAASAFRGVSGILGFGRWTGQGEAWTADLSGGSVQVSWVP